MKLLAKILMPIDVNSNCDIQLNAAIKIAKKYNSEIVAMYVLPDTNLHDDIKSLVANSINDSLSRVQETLEKEGVAAKRTIVEHGQPVEKIVQRANEEEFNLVLVGSGNSDEKEQFKLGINAEKLIRFSDIPLWVVKSNGKPEVSNILCPVDFSDPSRRALKNAILLSDKFKATLRILGVYEPVSNISKRLSINLDKENAHLLKVFEEKMDEFIRPFELNGIDHVIEIQSGSAHERILHAIDQHGCDLLVMGTNGRTGFSRFMMGSVTEKVTRKVPCSFITTKTVDIFKLRIDSEIKEIEEHFKNANELFKNRFYKEAIEQYLICLKINDMHIPSMYKLAEVYIQIGDKSKAEFYEGMAKDLLTRIWDKKIEYEIRKHYKHGK